LISIFAILSAHDNVLLNDCIHLAVQATLSSHLVQSNIVANASGLYVNADIIFLPIHSQA